MKRYFLQMIQILRENEEVVLYDNIFDVDKDESIAVEDYLKASFNIEKKEYPYVSSVPNFSPKAALWGAKTVYLVAQLILYRKSRPDELQELIEEFEDEITPSEILSADLCLRFLPEMIRELSLIDSEDPLIKILKDLLIKWPFSNIGQLSNLQEEHLVLIQSNDCLNSLFTNRIIQYKNSDLAKNAHFKPFILSALGIYKDNFWKELEL